MHWLGWMSTELEVMGDLLSIRKDGVEYSLKGGVFVEQEFIVEKRLSLTEKVLVRDGGFTLSTCSLVVRTIIPLTVEYPTKMRHAVAIASSQRITGRLEGESIVFSSSTHESAVPSFDNAVLFRCSRSRSWMLNSFFFKECIKCLVFKKLSASVRCEQKF
ncbi:hypothetical protein Tco_1538613 [Tanacetum coccineum]